MGTTTAIRTKQSRLNLKRTRTQLNVDNVEDEDAAARLIAVRTQLDALENTLKNMEASLNEFMRLANFNPPHPPAAARAANGILAQMDDLRTIIDNLEANMDAFFRFIRMVDLRVSFDNMEANMGVFLRSVNV